LERANHGPTVAVREMAGVKRDFAASESKYDEAVAAGGGLSVGEEKDAERYQSDSDESEEVPEDSDSEYEEVIEAGPGGPRRHSSSLNPALVAAASSRAAPVRGGAIRGARCRWPGGCEKRMQTGGYCRGHGGGTKCKWPEGCTKQPLKGGYCLSHGGVKTQTFCKWAEGCDKFAVKSGLCSAHGGGPASAPGEKCRWAEGCEKNAKRGGYCEEHTSKKRTKRTCQHPDGCEKQVVKKGLCRAHGSVAGVAIGPQKAKISVVTSVGVGVGVNVNVGVGVGVGVAAPLNVAAVDSLDVPAFDPEPLSGGESDDDAEETYMYTCKWPDGSCTKLAERAGFCAEHARQSLA